MCEKTIQLSKLHCIHPRLISKNYLCENSNSRFYNSEIFNNFDQFMIIALGRVIYFNDANKAVDFFKAQNFVCPESTNPAEFFMNMLSAENFFSSENNTVEMAYNQYKEAVIRLGQAYKSSDNPLKCDLEKFSEERSELSEISLEELRHSVPWTTQFSYLLSRGLRNTFRSPENTIQRFGITIGLMIIVMAMYWNLKTVGYEAMQDRVGAQFFLVDFCFLESMQNVILVFPEERAVFLREQASSLYSISAYFFSKILSELPLNMMVPLVALLMAYFSWGLNNNESYNFWMNLLNVELMYLASVGYGLIVSSLVANRNTLINILSIVVSPLLLLSGFYVSITKSHHIMWLLHFLSPCKYGFNIGIRNEFENSDIIIHKYTPYGVITSNGNDILKFLDLSPYEYLPNFLALFALMIISHIIAFICLYFFGRRVN